MLSAVLLASLLSACGDSPTGECGGTPPEITTFTITSSGVELMDDDETYLPTIEVFVDVEDIDGDLHAYALRVWVADELGDDMSTWPEPVVWVRESEGVDVHCQEGGAWYRETMYVDGVDLLYDTEYQWAAQATDAQGLASDLQRRKVWMPQEDGDEGGP